MQIDYKAILNDIIALGKDAVLKTIGNLGQEGGDYVANLLERLLLVANDLKERGDWAFAKERMSDEVRIFLLELRYAEVVGKAEGEKLSSDLLQFAQLYVFGLISK